MERKIGHAHLSFYRGYLNGLDIKFLADRYLEPGMDARVAKSTLDWIKSELCRAAIRHGRHAEARLIRTPITRRPAAPISTETPNVGSSHQISAQSSPETPNVGTQERLSSKTPNVGSLQSPSLEEFAKERDPSSFYSEAELIELYLEEYPDSNNSFSSSLTSERNTKKETTKTNNKKQKNKLFSWSAKAERLRRRQTEVLVWLESLLATDPAPSDAVESWFEGSLPESLKGLGILTLGDLTAFISRRGYRWWADVPRLGEVGAKAILAWLDEWRSTLGQISPTAFIKESALSGTDTVRPAQFGIAPLESLALPESCGGGATLQTIRVWLDSISSPNTQRAYRREVERLVLWSALERGQSVLTLDHKALDEYLEWLEKLGRTDDECWAWFTPQKEWFAPRNTKRWSPNWRPFDGPLSAGSLKVAGKIVRAFIGALGGHTIAGGGSAVAAEGESLADSRV